ncbi:uncharacterized protein MELLADRAFT_104369 [Melampsora larici-populina 98AG31]|uniref:Uncharacterized protein n=1 Tax=Melampsora larici-populina (strain 98AG31 / pathotype 3-4-7) TaxID=747676 RepID=F4REG6_MELLP|nr:uncharacterized protein MELLADRAFT_104369 [Melampsora larici-populina 98AG31]EGG09088.1 hypothetical protein MELLADRAFT_104369 [Melampsora larici-populina 98AG31]
MPRRNTTSLSQTIFAHYVGQAGSEIFDEYANDKGFTFARGAISTSGISNEDPFVTPIVLACLGRHSPPLNAGNIYALTCRLIGSNTSREDHFHFDPNDAIDLGPLPSTSLAFDTRPTIVITLSSVNEDPITHSLVVCTTRHYIRPSIAASTSVDDLHVGSEATFHSMLMDYNEQRQMWESEVRHFTLSVPIDSRLHGHSPPSLNHELLQTAQAINNVNTSCSAQSQRPNTGCYHDFYPPRGETENAQIGHPLSDDVLSYDGVVLYTSDTPPPSDNTIAKDLSRSHKRKTSH